MRYSLMLATLWLGYAGLAIAAEAPPTDPSAAAPPVTYRSTFDGYKPFREEQIVDWRKLNEEVGAAGGHMGIMGGAGGHAGHGAGTSKPADGKADAAEGGLPPSRSAPKAPGSGAAAPKQALGGAHAQH